MNSSQVVRAIFDREIERAEKDHELSDFIKWLEVLGDEVVAAVDERDWNPPCDWFSGAEGACAHCGHTKDRHAWHAVP